MYITGMMVLYMLRKDEKEGERQDGVQGKLIERYTTQGTLNRKYGNRNKSNSNKKDNKRKNWQLKKK